MTDPLASLAHLSPKRHALCSRLHAQRLAGRLMDQLGRPMAVIHTGNPLQPFRVGNCDGGEGRVVLEVRT
ncbi:hypothetical protein [Qipengyuania citrea]|uniref:hypothetical protein n=1 Tax=Qipengyuania citrea TaxID=225971 RepID=UPI003297DFE4